MRKGYIITLRESQYFLLKIIPYFKKKTINEIKVSDIRAWQNALMKKGYSETYLKTVNNQLSAIFNYTVRYYDLKDNPCRKAGSIGKSHAGEKEFWTKQEFKQFLVTVENKPEIKMAFLLLYWTGMRIGGVIGLTWNDVDMDEKILYVNHQVQYRKVQGDMKLYTNDTKTNACNRSIPMTDDVYRLFIEQKKVWLTTKKASDFDVDGYKDSVFVSHMAGKCINRSSVRRMMKSIVEMNSEGEIQLPNISPHILRYTACCRFAESGCDIKVLQYLVGQTDIRTTMRVYNHVDMGRVKRELDKLENLSKNKGNPISEFTPKFTPFARKSM